MVSFQRGYSPWKLADVTGVAAINTVTIIDDVFDGSIHILPTAILESSFDLYRLHFSLQFFIFFITKRQLRGKQEDAFTVSSCFPRF
jgi:hypothetical protein